MPRHIHGQLSAANLSFAIVVSRFNDLITQRLTDGAINTIVRHGGDANRIDVVHVPGAFEIPLAASRLASANQHDAVICLGAVIQGSTSHHEYINGPMASALMNLNVSSGKPVAFGVLTCENMEQALDRAGGKVGNKGEEAALAAIEMLSVLAQI